MFHGLVYNNISIILRDSNRMKMLLPPAICIIASDPKIFNDKIKVLSVLVEYKRMKRIHPNSQNEQNDSMIMIIVEKMKRMTE